MGLGLGIINPPETQKCCSLVATYEGTQKCIDCKFLTSLNDAVTASMNIQPKKRIDE